MKAGSGIFAVSMIALIVAAVCGWVMNIVSIFGSMADPLTGVFILRCIGVFIAPIGAVLGYL